MLKESEVRELRNVLKGNLDKSGGNVAACMAFAAGVSALDMVLEEDSTYGN